jgi:putative methanogen marker protein 4
VEDRLSMLTSEDILALPRKEGLRIGVGAGDDRQNVERSAAVASDNGYGAVEVFYDPESLITALSEGRVDAAVRGTLPSGPTMNLLKSSFGLDRVLRMALLEPMGGSMFFFAPVGIDEGWSVEDKLELITLGGSMMRGMGMEPKVAVLSGGRRSDLGRNAVVDRTIEDAIRVTAMAREAGFEARHGEILIESAVKDSNLIIAPDGISGNLIFRTLHFIGGGRALGAPVLNLNRPFIDTSRVKRDFVDAIALAALIATEMGESE